MSGWYLRSSLLFAFLQELVAEVSHIADLNPERAILLALSLIDLSLAGNLILIVIFSGYENFVSKLDAGGQVDRPAWMGTVDFSGLKLRLVGSIVAISAISLLRTFMRLGNESVDETYRQMEGHRPPDLRHLGRVVGADGFAVVARPQALARAVDSPSSSSGTVLAALAGDLERRLAVKI